MACGPLIAHHKCPRSDANFVQRSGSRAVGNRLAIVIFTYKKLSTKHAKQTEIGLQAFQKGQYNCRLGSFAMWQRGMLQRQ
jgi:hypothetical protein